MYLTKEDVDKIAKIMKEFPNARSYNLEQTGQSGIGSILNLTMDMEVNGHDAQVTVEISGVENW
jgi:hypothetical protein